MTSETLDVAFVVPLEGPAGIYGPSCLSCGRLAVEQLNAGRGIGGREVRLVIVNGGRDPEVVADEVERLVDSGRVQAVAGWHISAVRVAIARRVGGRVVYAFAAMHEGRDDTPGMFMLGERPSNQLLPAMRWMQEHVGVGRWAVIGNDYVFPRVASQVAREALVDTRSRMVSERFVPLGTEDYSQVVRRLARDDVDGVLMLLVGHDAVAFNRQFAAAGLDLAKPRLSTVVDENALLGGGTQANHNLFVSAAYFEPVAGHGPDDTFATAYYRRFGRFAPSLNAMGESCYEALLFLSRLADICGTLDIATVARMQSGHFYESPRGLMRLRGNLMDQNVYVAEADGLSFAVREQIAGV